jgi:DNA-binding NarL/FixJ family response regulator
MMTNELVVRRAPAITPIRSHIVKLLLMGKSNKEIADLLNKKLHSVKNHNEAIYQHYGVAGRAQLIVKLLSEQQKKEGVADEAVK